MDDNNLGDDDFVTNFDLNQEPFDGSSPPSPPAAPSSPMFRSTGIEDRIRLLEAVSARVRQPQRHRRVINNPALSFNFLSTIEPIVVVRNENQDNQEIERLSTGGDFTDRVNGERLWNYSRDASRLAKALEMDSDGQKSDNDKAVCVDDDKNVNMFDCNICLGKARDPILTCCGHLFCWGCFYQVPYVDSISKECPVCKGEVIDSNITPIYGNGNGKNSLALELESGVRIPPRPQAHRVESVRQQIVSRGSVHLQMADAIRRIRIGLGLGLNSLGSTSDTSLSNSEANRDGRLLSTLNRSERFHEGLETDVSNRVQPLYQETGTSVADTTVHIQSEPEEYLAAAVLHLGALPTDGDFEIDMTISPSRRTRGVSRTLSLEGESSLNVRRRRLW